MSSQTIASEPPPSAARVGLLILGHGSRDEVANEQFERVVAAYRDRHPELEVAHAYIELARPVLQDGLAVLARRCRELIALPLFLFASGHVKNDLPIALERARRQFPGVRFRSLPALGVHPQMVELCFERARAACSELGTAEKTGLIVVGRGSSDPDANGEFAKLVRLLGEGRDIAWVSAAFAGIARPLFESAVELLARARPERIVVIPYMLFAGRLIARLRAQVDAFARRYPWIDVSLAPHLGIDERLFAVMDERLAEDRPLPCDNCQYRTTVSGVAHQVNGLKALLFSVRHGFTHGAAMPHVHAHRSLSKHVLVCTNADCAARGSVPLVSALRRGIKREGRDADIRVTRTLCMGRCGEGPSVAVYPDGIWYRGVSASDADELVREHLIGDRLVGRLIDDIMQ